MVIDMFSALSQVSIAMPRPRLLCENMDVKVGGVDIGRCSFRPTNIEQICVPDPGGDAVSDAMIFSPRNKHLGATVMVVTEPDAPLTGPKSSCQGRAFCRPRRELASSSSRR
jgi:hypothetical protein